MTLVAMTFTLTSEPTPVTESGWDNGALIYNTGAAIAYASDDPGGQVTGFPVPAAGGSLTWDANRPLYLSTAGGTTTTVSVDDNSSSTVNSPSDLANAIIAAGLAGQIASAINLIGVPPVDQPQTLINDVFTANTTTGAYNYSYGFATLDVSKYQSLEMSFASSIPSATTQYFMWDVVFSDTPDITQTLNSYYGSAMASSTVKATIPVTGKYATIVLGWKGGALAAPPSFFFTVQASLRAVPAYDYYVINDLWNALSGTMSDPAVSDVMLGAVALYMQLPNAAATYTYYPSYRNRSGIVTLYAFGGISTTNYVSILLETVHNNARTFGAHYSDTTQVVSAPFAVGCAQPKLVITVPTAFQPTISLAMMYNQN